MTEQAESGINENKNKAHQDWIEFPFKGRAEQLRKEAEKAGEDASAILLGHVISVIIGDDSNSFFSARFAGYSPESVEYAKTGILGRLSLEIEFKETPEKLRKQLELTRDKLQVYRWEGEKGLNKAHEIWKETAKDWVINFRDTNPEIKEAYEKFISFEIKAAGLRIKKV